MQELIRKATGCTDPAELKEIEEEMNVLNEGLNLTETELQRSAKFVAEARRAIKLSVGMHPGNQTSN